MIRWGWRLDSCGEAKAGRLGLVLKTLRTRQMYVNGSGWFVEWSIQEITAVKLCIINYSLWASE
jgi:hypothetical protein